MNLIFGSIDEVGQLRQLQVFRQKKLALRLPLSLASYS